MIWKLSVFAVTALIWCSPAYAITIYDNGPPRRGGLRSDTYQPWTFNNADDFVLQTGRNTITYVHWYGGNIGAAVRDNFSIRIFQDNNGPDPVPLYDFLVGEVTKTSTGVYDPVWGGSRERFEYGTFIPAVTLVPEQTYWISIVNHTNGGDWAWNFASGEDIGPGDPFGRFADSGPWDHSTPYYSGLSFQLGNDVVPIPEPGTMLLLGGGLLAVGVRVRRKSTRCTPYLDLEAHSIVNVNRQT